MSIRHGASPPVGGPDHDGERQPVRRGLVFAIVGLALMMMSIDSTIVATALHTLQHDLDTSVNWAGWTITAYSFGFVLMLPVSGKLAEQYGRRRVFIGSVFAFTAASLLCGFADNIYVLIALRALQAAGGAGFTPSATGIIVDHFGDQRDRAVSFFGSIFPIGAMIGPIFGGLFVTYWSWRGIFLITVPIGIAVLLLAMRYVPRDRARAVKADAQRDFVGMALLGCGVFAAMLAISVLGEASVHAWPVAFGVPLVIAIVALWAFLRHIERAAHPFIAPRLIHGPGFGAVNLINAIFGGMPTGAVALIPLYAANRYGIDALRSGTLLVAQGAATTLLSVAAALLIRHTGYRLPLRVGGVMCAAGVALLAFAPAAGVSPYAWLAGAAFLVGAGRGTLNPASRNAGLQLEPEQASTLAAMRSMGMNIGTITTIAIATAVISGAADPGRVQAGVYVAAALGLVAALPLIGRITEHRGSW